MCHDTGGPEGDLLNALLLLVVVRLVVSAQPHGGASTAQQRPGVAGIGAGHDAVPHHRSHRRAPRRRAQPAFPKASELCSICVIE